MSRRRPGPRPRAQRHRRWGRRSGVLAAALTLLVTSFAPQAAEWAYSPSFRVRGEFNDNRRLTTGPRNDVFGTVVDLSAEASVTTERAGLSVTPLLRFTRYTGEDDLDSNDQFLDIESFYDLEKLRFSLDVDLTRDSTLTSELLTTGVVRERKRRERVILAPRLDLALSERTSLRVGGSHTDVSYIDAAATGLVDSTYDLLQGSLSYQLSERAGVFTTVYWTRFDVPARFTVTDSLGAQLGITYAFTETVSATAAAGYVRSESEINRPPIEIDTSADGYLLDFDLEAELERTRLGVGYSRTLSPTGDGFLVERDELSFVARHRLTSRLDARASVLAFRNRSLGGRDQSQDREAARVRIGLDWQAGRAWRLGAIYQFAIRDEALVTDSARSNAVFLQLNYAGDRRTLSR